MTEKSICILKRLRASARYQRDTSARKTATLQEEAAARIEALEAALERIKASASEWDGPLLRAWDASRAEIAEGDVGSGPRDRMESVFSALFWEVADDALSGRPTS